MDLRIEGQNIQVSENVKEFVVKKINKLERYLPNIQEIRVDLSKQKTARGADKVIAQITLRHARGAILRAEEKLDMANHDTILAAVNGAVDKMYTRISRFKTKGKSKRIRERYRATQEELRLAEVIPDAQEEIGLAGESEDLPPEIVRRKEVSVAAMYEDEAIEQMELLGHDFFMFFNLSTNSLCVLYKRENGGYGVLVPDMA